MLGPITTSKFMLHFWHNCHSFWDHNCNGHLFVWSVGLLLMASPVFLAIVVTVFEPWLTPVLYSNSRLDSTLFGKCMCVLLYEELKEMGLWSGKNLVYLECRYRRNSGEETNTQNLNYKRSVCGICLLGGGDICHTCREKCHLYVTGCICCILSLKH